jgi:hypothetical protein
MFHTTKLSVHLEFIQHKQRRGMLLAPNVSSDINQEKYQDLRKVCGKYVLSIKIRQMREMFLVYS